MSALALLPQHAALIAASGIAPEVAAARGYRSLTRAIDAAELGFNPAQAARVPALLVPVHGVVGGVVSHQIRPDQPRVIDGRELKYETPAGSRMVLDVPPAARADLGDPHVPLDITEGARKADAAVSQGACCIALLGVWNWRGSNKHGGKVVLADWDSIALNERTVRIIFDSDVMTKQAVRSALERLTAFLQSRGARVQQVYLPDAPDGGKMGLDDYLAAGHTMEDVYALAVAAEVAAEVAADAPPAPEATTGKGRGPSQASQLAALAADADLFHDAAGETYATIAVSNHRETHPTKSKPFRLWLVRRYYEEHGGVPGNQAVADAQAKIAGDALFAGEERPVHVRLAEHGERIYIDLADPQWRVVEIDAGGWRILAATDCPVRFRRTKGMKPLPEPTRGGTVAALRPFVNVATDADFVLLVAWLVAALRPHGPYPLLNIHGEQGSAKTTTARVCRDLVDPHEAPVRSLPRDERDLMISATNNWLPVFDNVSGIPVWLSDALCRIATGGGFATRELYADADETILNAQRPVILTGIEDVANRSDLLDRSIITTLPRIPDHKRKTEAAFNLSFAIARPAIFGALCSAVAGALANVAAVQLSRLPRMADFAVWATAAEAACGFAAGAFMDAYMQAREDANATAIEASAIGAAVLAFAKGHSGQWCGTAGELLAELHRHADDKTRTGKEWPADGTRLSGKLRRIAPNLRAVGVALDLSGKRTAGKRTVTLEWVGKTASSASRASHEDAEGSGGKENGDDATHDAVKKPPSLLPLAASSRDADDATRDATDLAASSHEGRQGKGNDADDADDAVSRLYPEPFSDALDWEVLTNWCAQMADGTTAMLGRYVRTVAARCGLPPAPDEPAGAFAQRLAGWLHAHREAA